MYQRKALNLLKSIFVKVGGRKVCPWWPAVLLDYKLLAFWAEWLASLRHLSLKATNFAKPIIISDRKLNSKKIGSVWISFRFNHFLAIWLAVSLKQLTYSVSLHNCIYQSYAVRVAVHKSSSSVKSKVGWNRHPVPAYSLLLCYS